MTPTQTPTLRSRPALRSPLGIQGKTVRRSTAILVLFSSLWTAPAAAGELRRSAERHAEAVAAQAGTLGMAASVNPHKKTALILGGVGAATLAIGLLRNVPKKCANVTYTAYCSIGSDTKLVVAGLAVMGAGGAMYFIGEGKKSIGIAFVPQGVAVQQRIRF